MKKGTTTFLKIAVFIIGLLVIVFCSFWLPGLASEAAAMNPEYAYLKLPVLIGLYLTAIPFFLALNRAWRLLNDIESGNAFSERSVIFLRHIKNCAGSIIFLYVAGILLLAINNALHPGIAVAGVIILFATLVIAVFAAVLQKLLKSALDIKEENDLTV
ncbi:DUF2975 domain-containing protein [Ammoniphilus resinae]|uniref:Glucan phosphoethanolaminetransferase (Alkaline phosphatase superfamily) n=1 Tax=Ammoniphilus resinae TaxID=861532 RepID=A0ABS4GS53_9BACL|nr:DUF2975 domain-containing protein [Ammoniphilus resinae]MBP1933107.1 glucan phosphoethanolaminetransferase (alkaline phosphatase superfamily) [Ammoniphilus resinae]